MTHSTSPSSWSVSPRPGGGCADQSREIAGHQIANSLDGQVGRAIGVEVVGIESVVALPRKHSGHALAPDTLNRRQDAQLVIYHDVVLRRIEFGDGIQHL